MKFIKNYIKKLVKEAVDEVLKEPDIDLQQYQVELFKDKGTLWSTILTQEVVSLDFQVEYIDENNHKREYEFKFKNISEMYMYFQGSWEDMIPDDLVNIIEAKLLCWYMYKDIRELISYRFTDFNKTYKPDMLNGCFSLVKEWCDARPELFL